LAKKLALKGIQIDPYRVGSWKSIENDILSVDRKSKIVRETNETKISVEINLAVSKPVNIDTGIGFFDHMLEQLAKHSDTSIIIQCHGDLNIDEHHSVEDIALTLGQAFRQALGKKYGINRYGFTLPMDESIASVTLDLSGRPYFSFKGHFSREKVGGLPTELIPHFFQSLSQSLKASIHIEVNGDDNHHMIEACFKAFGRAFNQAISLTGNSLPSTKGVL
jgi:imidazoleglycerol-phosphate dehydratase/histidinol-phosphatase